MSTQAVHLQLQFGAVPFETIKPCWPQVDMEPFEAEMLKIPVPKDAVPWLICR